MDKKLPPSDKKDNSITNNNADAKIVVQDEEADMEAKVVVEDEVNTADPDTACIFDKLLFANMVDGIQRVNGQNSKNKGLKLFIQAIPVIKYPLCDNRQLYNESIDVIVDFLMQPVISSQHKTLMIHTSQTGEFRSLYETPQCYKDVYDKVYGAVICEAYNNEEGENHYMYVEAQKDTGKIGVTFYDPTLKLDFDTQDIYCRHANECKRTDGKSDRVNGYLPAPLWPKVIFYIVFG